MRRCWMLGLKGSTISSLREHEVEGLLSLGWGMDCFGPAYEL